MEYLHTGWNRVYENTVSSAMCLHLPDNSGIPIPVILPSAPASPEPTSIGIYGNLSETEKFMNDALASIHPYILPQEMR
jgi:hypothetical protein